MSAAAEGARALRSTGTGVDLRVRLTPKASRDRLGGREVLADGNEVVIAHVRALPADGAANAALEAMVAKAAGVAKSRVAVVAGKTSRVKTLRLEGNSGTILATLEAILTQAE